MESSLASQAADLADDDRVCPHCGYDLRASGARCPECGLDLNDVVAAVIPWENHRTLGRVRAFARTVWLVSHAPGRLRYASSRPIDLSAARRFRQIITALFGAVLAVTLMATLRAYEFGSTIEALIRPSISVPQIVWPLDLVRPWAAGVGQWPTLPLACVVWAWLIARVHDLFFAPGRLDAASRARGRALAAYASATLPWTMAILLLAVGVLWFHRTRHTLAFRQITRLRPIDAHFILMAAGAASFAFYWRRVGMIYRAATRASFTSTLATMFIGLPAAWLAATVLALGLLPWLTGLVVMLIDSQLP